MLRHLYIHTRCPPWLPLNPVSFFLLGDNIFSSPINFTADLSPSTPSRVCLYCTSFATVSTTTSPESISGKNSGRPRQTNKIALRALIIPHKLLSTRHDRLSTTQKTLHSHLHLFSFAQDTPAKGLNGSIARAVVQMPGSCDSPSTA